MFTHNTTSTPSGLAFAGNPIIVRHDASDVEGSTDPVAEKFFIKFNDRTVFSGKFNAPLVFDMSSIAEAVTPPVPEVSGDDYKLGPLHLLIDEDNFINGRLLQLQREGSKEPFFSVYVLPGGISAAEIRCHAKDEDVFTNRFLNYDDNFFLTDRTAGQLIHMKETEIHPLYFILDRTARDFIYYTDSGEYSYDQDEVAIGIWAVDIDALRKEVFLTTGKLCNVFHFRIDGHRLGATVVISRADTTTQRYRLKYRNRFGVFEIMELAGDLEHTFSNDDSTDDSYTIYEPDSGQFMTRPLQLSVKDSLRLTSGCKTIDEFRQIRNILSSSEVYLLDYGSSAIRVKVSCEEFSFKPSEYTPKEFSLVLDCCDSDQWPTIPVDTMHTRRQRNIFTSEFTPPFS